MNTDMQSLIFKLFLLLKVIHLHHFVTKQLVAYNVTLVILPCYYEKDIMHYLCNA